MSKFLNILIILLTSYNTFANQCRVEASVSDYAAMVAIDVGFTSSCVEGVQLAQACGYTQARDSIFTLVAQEKCEADFLTQLTDSEKSIYYSRQDICNEKWKNVDHPLAYSQVAFCRLAVARDYSKHYKK